MRQSRRARPGASPPPPRTPCSTRRVARLSMVRYSANNLFSPRLSPAVASRVALDRLLQPRRARTAGRHSHRPRRQRAVSRRTAAGALHCVAASCSACVRETEERGMARRPCGGHRRIRPAERAHGRCGRLACAAVLLLACACIGCAGRPATAMPLWRPGGATAASSPDASSASSSVSSSARSAASFGRSGIMSGGSGNSGDGSASLGSVDATHGGRGLQQASELGHCSYVTHDKVLPDYQWFTPDKLRSKAQSTLGDRARLRAALDRYQKGEQLTVRQLEGRRRGWSCSCECGWSCSCECVASVVESVAGAVVESVVESVAGSVCKRLLGILGCYQRASGSWRAGLKAGGVGDVRASGLWIAGLEAGGMGDVRASGLWRASLEAQGVGDVQMSCGKGPRRSVVKSATLDCGHAWVYCHAWV
eukprot:354175-Chlamydomonas_euryale.AAC.12